MGKNLQQLQKPQAKVPENECSHFVEQNMLNQANDVNVLQHQTQRK
jgi:hypothetical protein